MDNVLRFFGGMFLGVCALIWCFSALFSPLAVMWLFFNH